MAKAAYGGIAIKLGAAENRLQMVAQKMAQMQRCMQTVVQNAVQYSRQKVLQSSVQMVVQKKNGTDANGFADAELRAGGRAVVCAVLRADIFADLRAVVRAELLQSGCAKGQNDPSVLLIASN